MTINKQTSNNMQGNYYQPVQQNTAVFNTIGPCILCICGEFAGISFYVSEKGLMIGRSRESCDIVFSETFLNISRIHCFVCFNYQTQMYIVYDRGSSNGTFLWNGERVQTNTPAFLQRGECFYLVDKKNTFQVL